MDMNITTLPKRDLKARPYNIDMEKRDLKTRPYDIDMEKRDLKTRPYNIDMEKRDLYKGEFQAQHKLGSNERA